MKTVQQQAEHMAKRLLAIREARMWICRFYANRGLGLNDKLWQQFKAFCEAHPDDYTDQPLPGNRTDAHDPWRIYFGLEDLKF